MNSRIKEDVHRLFEFWCEVSPAASDDKAPGHIIQSFPESFKDTPIIKQIPEFVYPCEFINDSVQTYSFVLTSDDSKFRFGFCRHDPRSQSAMVIITYLPWHDTFIKFMNVLGELLKSSSGEFQPFLSEAYNKGVPEPGASLKLFYHAGISNFMFQRPSQFQLPSIPENHNLNLYYNFVDPKCMIGVFAAMLAERRIVFTSSRLDRLSSCIQAANAFLYPMVWQHIFIPILPMKMRDFLDAPMPFLIGAPNAVLMTMTREELGDMVILDCDRKILESPFDDVKSMPPELIAQLKKQLANSHEHGGDRISKIFLGILVQLIGGYRDAVKFSQGQRITWDRDTFVESRPPHLRPFLRNMMELQIFQQFIEERLEMLNTGLGFSDEFELETLRHAEKLAAKRGKQYKEFLKNVKDKTNPAMKSAVKSVKEGSRGVKTAYKDLKSKLRDITPPKSHVEMSRNHDGNTSSAYHRSAPSSPVFNRRQQSETYRKPSGSQLQTSNSMMNSSYNNFSSARSPTSMSPPSSNSSSEMNILQELQQHALFKTQPQVDRSLKPSPQRTGAPLNTPRSPVNGGLKEVPVATLCEIEDETDDPVAVLPNDAPALISLDDSASSLISNTHKVKSFDVPPDVPSPPVPAPRPSQLGVAATSTVRPRGAGAIVAAGGSKPSPLSFENDFVSNAVSSKTIIPQHRAPPSLSSSALCVPTNQTTAPPLVHSFSSTSNPSSSSCLPKISPTARGETEVPAEKQPDQSSATDLITLDTSNNSFELEDFDPLNKHAKPLPLATVATCSTAHSSSAASSVSASSSSSTSSSNTIASQMRAANALQKGSFSNPAYPFYTPQHLASAKKLSIVKSANNDDDLELLRKYGLDQFHLSESNLTNGNGQRLPSTSAQAARRTNWMTFD